MPLVSRVIDDIVKSEEDRRSYRGLELSNGMKVILLSDPTTDKSSAALDVHVGYMSDPEQLPGLAHFCEHMLFLGTEKYPIENDYDNFLNEHSGSSNAFTGTDHTNYYFAVAPEYLEGALDRFAQFFLSPLFTESSTDREVNAVNSEHEKNVKSDDWRMAQLNRSMANPGHAFSKFGTGNKKTLDEVPRANGLNVRDELLKFHSQWYSANIMALAVLGKEGLDDLQRLVVKLFSHVATNAVAVPEWKDHPFTDQQLRKQSFAVPVMDVRYLKVIFPIPDFQPYYKSCPGDFLAHLIGHEGPGSLLSELKSKGWVNTLSGGEQIGAKGFGFFTVGVDLTEEGIDHVEDIVTNLFQYLNMLRKELPQEWIFNECADLQKIAFCFKDKESPGGYTCTLAGRLHVYPLEEVLCGPYLMTEYRPELIQMVLDKLNAKQILIAVVGKKFKDIADQEEAWYGTMFKIQDVPEATLQKWQNAGSNLQFVLPPKNEFIPTNFELVPREDPSAVPVLLMNSSMSRLWYKQDDEYLLPKSEINFEIVSPLANLDPLHCNLAYMLVQLFEDSMTEYSYALWLAGLGYSLTYNKYGIVVSVGGYNDKQHVLLEKVMDKLTHFEIDWKRFENIKEEHIRGLNNFSAMQPHIHAHLYTDILLTERDWTVEELLQATDDLSFDRMQMFVAKLLSKVHIEGLIHGNVTKETARELASVVEKQLVDNMKAKPLLNSQLVRDREVQLNYGSFYVYKAENSVHRSSCIMVYYPSGFQETHTNVVLELFCQIIKEPCFNILRTQEQLGYIVDSGARRANGAQGFFIVVQSERNPEYLDGRIEAFLFFMKNHIKKMSEEQFLKHREALAALRLEKPKKLMHRTAEYWDEIESRQYNFDRDNIEVAHLRTLTKNDVYDFYETLIAHDAILRRKFAVHVVSTAPSSFELAPPADGLERPPTPVHQQTVVGNITEFKRSHTLSPLIRPYISI